MAAVKRLVLTAGLLALSGALTAEPAPAEATVPEATRQQELVRLVRQDCGACHGLQLTGGLGPALTPEVLAGKPAPFLAATIHQGRPGTAMAAWQAMLSEDEARWIAEQLLQGFPEEK